MKRPTVYLIGSMEHAPDGGKNSFDTRAKFCRDLGYVFINPVEEEESKTGFSAADSQGKIDGYRRSGNIEMTNRIFDAIWRVDLWAIKSCDFMWMHIEPEDRVGGTVKEVTFGTLLKSLDLIASHKDATERDKENAEICKLLLKRLGLGTKPIYVTCFGGYTKINGSIEHMVRQSGGKIFDTWKETCEFLEETYGKFLVEEPKKEEKDGEGKKG